MLKGYQKLIVLEELKKGPKSGYDIIKRIKELTGKGSPGYVYPLLKEFKDKGFISLREEGRKKLYELNKKGIDLLKEIEAHRKTLLLAISGFIKRSKDVGEEDDSDLLFKCEKYQSYIILDIDLHREFHKAKCLVYENNFKTKRDKFRKILKRTIKELYALAKE